MASPDDPDDPDDNDDILEITPEPGTRIEDLAPFIVEAMEELEVDAAIHFPTFTLDVPLGSTAKDIIDAYNLINIEYLPDLRPPPKPPAFGPKL